MMVWLSAYIVCSLAKKEAVAGFRTASSDFYNKPQEFRVLYIAAVIPEISTKVPPAVAGAVSTAPAVPTTYRLAASVVIIKKVN
jgi:hypothetical protein